MQRLIKQTSTFIACLSVCSLLSNSVSAAPSNCRVSWPDFFQLLREKNSIPSVQHVAQQSSPRTMNGKGYCSLEERTGTLSILPYKQEQHYCELQFPAEKSSLRKLKNGWHIQRLDVKAYGSRWIMKRNHMTGGFSFRLQGDSLKKHQAKIEYVYLRNQQPGVACDDPARGWRSLF